jgi:hypothetical protein
MSFNSSGLIGVASLVIEGRTELTLIFLLLSRAATFTAALSASLLPNFVIIATLRMFGVMSPHCIAADEFLNAFTSKKNYK